MQMIGMIDANTKDNERGLLPYPIILAENKGDPEAMKYVVLHYGSYMYSLSFRILYDERVITYWGIDVAIHDSLRSKLMQGILAFYLLLFGYVLPFIYIVFLHSKH